MVMYLLIILTFSLDMISMIKSGNTKDKVPYIISMIIVCVIGGAYLWYGDEIQIIDRLFELLKINGGV